MHRSDFPQIARLAIAFGIAALLLVGVGCAPSVGDSCAARAECPSGAICDTTAPNGYCTFEACVRNGCGDDSICIFFDEDISYCMKSCTDDADCRTDDGYVCRDDVGDVPFCYVAASVPGS
jgi:hypothetical protein